MDPLTSGKFRLGAGIGWNRVQYEALGEDFSRCGKCLEEHHAGALAAERETVTFSRTFHRITGAGLAPMPVQRPIPVWVGAQSPCAYRRAGRLLTLFPQRAPGPQLDEARRIVAEEPPKPAVTRPASAWKGACAGRKTGTSSGQRQALAGCGRHAPVSQHHGRLPEDRR